MPSLESITQAIRPWMPFTALNTVWRLLDPNARTILDVGCGPGRPMEFLRGRRSLVAVGVDIFEPYLRQCQEQSSHDELVRAEVRSLPFRPNSVDVVLCMEVLEHLEEDDGRDMLNAAEEIARRQVVITTPVGRFDQHEYDGNPHQEHRFIWAPGQLRRLGYKVMCNGLRGLGGKSGGRSPFATPLRPLVDLVWVAAGPVTRVRTEWSGHMVAVKNLAGARK